MLRGGPFTFTKDRQLVCRHAQCDLHEYETPRINPNRVFAQSFNLNDVLYWLAHQIVPSEYGLAAKANKLDIITWTLERSGFLTTGGGYYYQYVTPVINNDGDMYTVLDVLAKQVGIRGIFSDWPATVTYYANCMGL